METKTDKPVLSEGEQVKRETYSIFNCGAIEDKLNTCRSGEDCY